MSQPEIERLLRWAADFEPAEPAPEGLAARVLAGCRAKTSRPFSSPAVMAAALAGLAGYFWVRSPAPPVEPPTKVAASPTTPSVAPPRVVRALPGRRASAR